MKRVKNPGQKGSGAGNDVSPPGAEPGSTGRPVPSECGAKGAAAHRKVRLEMRLRSPKEMKKLNDAIEILRKAGMFMLTDSYGEVADGVLMCSLDVNTVWLVPEGSPHENTDFVVFSDTARENGIPLLAYLRYLRYAEPLDYCLMGAADTDPYGGTCSHTSSQGRRCSRHVTFKGPYHEFRHGIDDRCSTHRKERKEMLPSANDDRGGISVD